MLFLRPVTAGTGNWGWVFARPVTGGTGVNGLINFDAPIKSVLMAARNFRQISANSF